MKSFTSLILIVPLSPIYHRSLNKLVILNSKDWGQKRSQSNKIDLRMFCKKLPFDSLFFSESQVFPVGFWCFEDVPCKALYSEKNEVLNDSQTMWDSFQTLELMQKTCFFIFLESYIHVQDQAYMHMHHGCTCRLIPACACRGLSWLYFSKNRFICSLNVTFFILTFFKSI